VSECASECARLCSQLTGERLGTKGIRLGLQSRQGTHNYLSALWDPYDKRYINKHDESTEFQAKHGRSPSRHNFGKVLNATTSELTSELNKERVEALQYLAIVETLLVGMEQARKVPEFASGLEGYAGLARRWSTGEAAASGAGKLPDHWPAPDYMPKTAVAAVAAGVLVAEWPDFDVEGAYVLPRKQAPSLELVGEPSVKSFQVRLAEYRRLRDQGTPLEFANEANRAYFELSLW
jgi:hypothetical protein